MLSVSLQWRWNCLLSDVGLTRQSRYLVLLISLSLQMPFIQHKNFWIHLYIYINSKQQQYPKISKSFSMSTQRTPLNSRTALVTKSGTYMLKWIRKQKNSILFHFFLAKHYGTSAKKRNMISSLRNGILSSKHQSPKEEIFLIC